MNNLNEVKLGDLAYEVSERVANPSESGYERFVGLEHLDSGSFYVNRWGSTSDVKSSMKLFKKGDLLFARRNTYLKRASVADFDGVCSGDIIVLREYDTTIKGITLLIMNLDKFWDFTIANSAGTMSKRAKWREISEFSLNLPSSELQSIIINRLNMIESYINNQHILKDKLTIYKNKFIKFVFTHGMKKSQRKDSKLGEIPKDWSIKKLGDIITLCQYGISDSLKESGDIPVFRMNNIINQKMDLSNMKYIDLEENILDKYRLDKYDILFNRTNSFDLVGKTGIYLDDKQAIFASYLVRIKANPDIINPLFLNYYMNSYQGQNKIKAYRTPGVSQCNINAENLKKLFVPIPTLDEQNKIVENLVNIDSTLENLQLNIHDVKNIKKELLHKLLDK